MSWVVDAIQFFAGWCVVSLLVTAGWVLAVLVLGARDGWQDARRRYPESDKMG